MCAPHAESTHSNTISAHFLTTSVVIGSLKAFITISNTNHINAHTMKSFSIIALPSTAQNGTVSRIVPHLSEGAGVATTRADVNFIITEFGIAELKGKGIYQRVMELAQIAHPKFREELIEVAKKRHYIFADQLPPSREDLLFLEGYKSTLLLKNGKTKCRLMPRAATKPSESAL